MAHKECAFCGTAFEARSRRLTCSAVCRKAHAQRANVARSNKWHRERWATDPEFKARRIEQRRKREEDPEYRARQAEQRRKRASDPRARARRIEQGRKRYSDPEARERELEKKRTLYATDPDYRARALERSSTRYAADPEARARQAEQRRKRASDPRTRVRKNELRRARYWTDEVFREKALMAQATYFATARAFLRRIRQEIGPLPAEQHPKLITFGHRAYRKMMADAAAAKSRAE